MIPHHFSSIGKFKPNMFKKKYYEANVAMKSKKNLKLFVYLTKVRPFHLT